MICFFFFFQAEDGIRDYKVTGVQTCALPISERLAWAIRAQIVEAEDQHTLELAGALERAWREERGGAADAAASLAWRREVMRAARALTERAPERVAQFRRRLQAYRARLSESRPSHG